MPQHPTPWKYDTATDSVYDASGSLLFEPFNATADECRMMAAAPEMLQLLRDATECEGRAELAVVLAAARSLIARLDNG